ncbi:unnamed protein product, partial [Laminaria digitata]
RTKKQKKCIYIPGTGKTLLSEILSETIAGEAGVPFFSISGSEFVEVFCLFLHIIFQVVIAVFPRVIFIGDLYCMMQMTHAKGGWRGGGKAVREATLLSLVA